MSEATFKVGPYTGAKERDDAYVNTLTVCNWCGKRVRWLGIGDHLEEHHRTQRVYREFQPTHTRVEVFAEWQGRDATDEEVGR